ncbi:D-alanyl-D-alanine carboxypeptidase family protein [Lentibacillus kimchii]
MKRFIALLALAVALTPFSLMAVKAEAADADLSLSSEAAVMIDSETGDILYQKQAEKSMYPASLTKMATAVYAIENANLDERVTVSENAAGTEGSSVYLEEDEDISLKKLLQGLLINSGNDAAVAIAEHIDGSVSQFASTINDYLREQVGVHDTHFENPNGLFNKDHVTTAKDLAAITRYAMRHDTFREIFGTKELDWHGETWDTTLYTHHKLMREDPYDGVVGGKTGFVDESGHTLATAAERDGLKLIVITLDVSRKDEAYADTTKLLDDGFDHFEESTIDKGTAYTAGSDDYQTDEKLTYTHDLDKKVRQDVTEDGELEISQPDEGVIASVPLAKAEDQTEAKTEKADHNAEGKSLLHRNDSLMMVIPLTAVVIGAAGILFHRKRKRNSFF